MAKLILVADDEVKNRQLLHDMLGVWGYDTVEAVNGFQAIDVAKKSKPDLILMDIMMPGKDGYTACSEIVNDPATGSIPIIMVTGLDQSLNRSLGIELGIVGYVTKPVNPDELKELIGKYI